MKIKYWTACINHVQGKVFITATGSPFCNLREAKRAKKKLNSSNAVVVNSDANSSPTTDIVG